MVVVILKVQFQWCGGSGVDGTDGGGGGVLVVVFGCNFGGGGDNGCVLC